VTSTPTPKAVEPGDALPASGDERFAEAYKQITRADEELTRLSSQLEKMEKDTARGPSARSQQPSTAAYPPSAGLNSPSAGKSPSARLHSPSAGIGPQSPPGRLAFPVVAGLSLAGCAVIVVLALQWSYDEQAKVVVAPSPQLVSTAASPPDNPPHPVLSAPSPVPVNLAQPAPVQPSPLAQSAPQDATSALPDATQLQALARDLANAQRTIEQLRADQQRIARENAKTIEELRASQEEMKQALARTSEQKPLPPPTPVQTAPVQAAPTQPAAARPPTQPSAALRKPERTYQPPRARARPRIPSRDWYYDEW
jgi:hypothetical protein